MRGWKVLAFAGLGFLGCSPRGDGLRGAAQRLEEDPTAGDPTQDPGTSDDAATATGDPPIEHVIAGLDPDEGASIDATMHNGFCTPTSVRLDLAYWGIDVSTQLVAALSWDYGFSLRDDGHFATAFPTTDPPAQIAYMASELGFTYEPHTHASVADAEDTIVSLVADDVPALVQWAPHTVLAYGYENGGARVFFHDPRDLDRPAGEGDAFGFGAAQVQDPAEWDDQVRAWGSARQYLVIAMRPLGGTDADAVAAAEDTTYAIDWDLVTAHAAGITRDGVPAIRDLAARWSDLSKNGYFDLTFYFGRGSRADAADFLDGRGYSAAAEALRASADAFAAADAEFAGERDDATMSTLISAIADAEDKVADALGGP